MPPPESDTDTQDGPAVPFETLPEESPLLAGQMRPEAMAIGDSIFNGVRSATISEDLAQGSPPAQVGRAFGWGMAIPDYRRPVLFDLEAEVREGVDLARLRRHAIENADRWIEERGEWSGRNFFDNVAIAGATYRDLHERTAGAERRRIPGLLARLRASSDFNFDVTAQLWFSLNTAFVLSPSAEPEIDELTPLEQVASRKPRRLFVNIGPNEGLFRIGITGSFSRQRRAEIRRIPGLARTLAETLENECADVERIYFNLLIRPRTIANLAPRTDAEMFETPGDGYFERYVGRLAALNGMSAAQMRQFDDDIARTNEETAAAMTEVLGGRIAFVDTYAMSTELDGKHYGNARKLTVDRGGTPNRLSNQPLSANPYGFRQGGLFGLDNMHPTRVGYALIGQRMADLVAATEGMAAPQLDLQAAFDGDTLLQDPPRSWDALNLLMSLIASLGFDDLLA